MAAYDINSIPQLIAALGEQQLYDELPVFPGTLDQWRRHQSILPALHLRLLIMAYRNGKTIAPRVFGLDEGELPEGLFWRKADLGTSVTTAEPNQGRL